MPSIAYRGSITHLSSKISPRDDRESDSRRSYKIHRNEWSLKVKLIARDRWCVPVGQCRTESRGRAEERTPSYFPRTAGFHLHSAAFRLSEGHPLLAGQLAWLESRLLKEHERSRFSRSMTWHPLFSRADIGHDAVVFLLFFFSILSLSHYYS